MIGSAGGTVPHPRKYGASRSLQQNGIQNSIQPSIQVSELEVGPDVAARTADPGPTTVGRCVDAIRQLILTGELLPGETIRQGKLADQLGTSRIPVREALTTLQAEGVVTYTPRVGHAVARFNPAEFAQIYLMRRLLETELVSSAELDRVDVRLLAALNDQLEQLDTAASGPLSAGRSWLWERKRLNWEFHFHLFRLSPHQVIRAEVERLWNMSEFYRSLYAYEPDTQQRIVAEHRAIIAAIESGSRPGLLDELDRHRGGAEAVVLRRLGPFPPGGS
jgi:DNA-binding GntR family transcriptional regulator